MFLKIHWLTKDALESGPEQTVTMLSNYRLESLVSDHELLGLVFICEEPTESTQTKNFTLLVNNIRGRVKIEKDPAKTYKYIGAATVFDSVDQYNENDVEESNIYTVVQVTDW